MSEVTDRRFLNWKDFLKTFVDVEPEDGPFKVVDKRGPSHKYTVLTTRQERNEFRSMACARGGVKGIFIGGVSATWRRPLAKPGNCELYEHSLLKGQKFWKAWRKQTVNVSRFETNKKNKKKSKKELSMTTFFPARCYRGMKRHDRLAYMRSKARDIDNGAAFFDNEFVASGKCRLAFELDLTEGPGFNKSWEQRFVTDAAMLTRFVQQIFPKNKSVFARCLGRRPAVVEGSANANIAEARKKKISKIEMDKLRSGPRDWKYGLHIVFPEVIVSLKKGKLISDFAVKSLFKERPSGYLDPVFVGTQARMRPAYARKVKNDSEGKPYGTGYYAYQFSTNGKKMWKEVFTTTLDELRGTSLFV